MTIDMPRLNSRIVPSSEKLDGLASFLKSTAYSSILVISDHQVFPLHGGPLLQLLEETGQTLAPPMLIPAGEQSKSLAIAESCWTHMHAVGLDRKSLVIGFGGGVVTDLAGYVASCYMRGVAVAQIPTTLMGMVDAAIGGKTAVNLPTGKNLVGTFYHPRLILIAPHYLQTLQEREYRSGLGEVIKYGVIRDAGLFAYLEQNMEAILRKETKALEIILERSCAIKAEVVQSDEKEAGLRAILNWGHTFAHAIETMTHYNTYLHGEAVAIGMNCAACTSRELGLVDDLFVKRQRDLCRHAGLPTLLPKGLDVDRMVALMAGDKKAVSGKITCIVARAIGQVEIASDVDPALIKKAVTPLISQ